MANVFSKSDRDLATELFEAVRVLSAVRQGVSRPAYSDMETATAGVIVEYARRHGLEARYDAAANLVIEMPGASSSNKPALWIGSHLDSVPEGGNYDGLAGIVAGLMCQIKAQSQPDRLSCPLTLVGLRGEEAAWFGRTYLGSYALLGKMSEKDLELPHRDSGRPLREYMAAAGADVESIGAGKPLIDPAGIGAWLELHIEQGPVLAAEGTQVAIVDGIRGSIRHTAAHCLGIGGHSGVVPRELRHDAVLGVSEVLTRLDDHWSRLEADGADLVWTCGIVGTNAQEHAVSRIAGDVTFSMDIRSQSLDTMEQVHTLFLDECAAVEKSRGVSFELGERIVSPPAVTDRGWMDRLGERSGELGYGVRELPSGAGHDAAVFANAGIHAAMVFVRNYNGSHNPEERMEMDDFMAGVEVLYQTVTNK